MSYSNIRQYNQSIINPRLFMPLVERPEDKYLIYSIDFNELPCGWFSLFTWDEKKLTIRTTFELPELNLIELNELEDLIDKWISNSFVGIDPKEYLSVIVSQSKNLGNNNLNIFHYCDLKSKIILEKTYQFFKESENNKYKLKTVHGDGSGFKEGIFLSKDWKPDILKFDGTYSSLTPQFRTILYCYSFLRENRD